MWDDKKIQKELNKIPIENMIKFNMDLCELIKKAQQEDYENYNIR